MTKRFGFTLAEVLITLGIIGVVAAMTMPTLMNSTQGAQYKAAYKKALSALSQAVTLNVALDEWNFADAQDVDKYRVGDLLNARMNVVRTEKATFKDAKGKDYAPTGDPNGLGGEDTADAPGSNNTTLFFNDGTMFTFETASAGCTMDETQGASGRDKVCKGFIDVNGIKAPNKFVKCDGTGSKRADNSGSEKCEIKNPTDVYPVVFYDQTVLPNSPAARAVLYAK